MSEDAAFRRSRAARIARRFPALFAQIAAGEIHLTGVLILGPHLTEENHAEVLARAKHRSKKEIAHLVRMLNPLPDVPAVVEPLGPRNPVAPARNPTWRQFASRLSGPVRELATGDRPKDWTQPDAADRPKDWTYPDVADRPNNCIDADAGDTSELPDSATLEPRDLDGDEPGDDEVARRRVGALNEHGSAAQSVRVAPSPDSAMPSAAQRYKVQFTATQEYVDLLDEACNLLARTGLKPSLENVHLRAMRMLVTQLRKRKYAAGEKREARRVKPPPCVGVSRRLRKGACDCIETPFPATTARHATYVVRLIVRGMGTPVFKSTGRGR